MKHGNHPQGTLKKWVNKIWPNMSRARAFLLVTTMLGSSSIQQMHAHRSLLKEAEILVPMEEEATKEKAPKTDALIKARITELDGQATSAEETGYTLAGAAALAAGLTLREIRRQKKSRSHGR